MGIAFLYVFYRAVQLNWPESYFGATELSAYAISSSPIRYALFRLGPVYLTAVFAAVTVDRIGGNGSLIALGIGVGHALVTSGWAIVQATRWPSGVRKNRLPVLLLRGAMLVAVIVTSLVAAISIPILSPIIPPLTEISATIWTGIIAGVIGAYISRVSRGHAINQNQLVVHARQEIPIELWKLAGKIAADSGADVDLARSVMLVEHIQRPRWFRQLERIKGSVLRNGTYGIMQVYSDRPLNDSESIHKAIEERLAAVSVRTETGDLDWEAFDRFASSYNDSSDYRVLLMAAFNSLRPSGNKYATLRTAFDNHPVIEVIVLERFDDILLIEGTAAVYEGTLRVQVHADNRTLYEGTVQARRGGPERGWWSAIIPVSIDASKLIIEETFMTVTPSDVEDNSKIVIDLSDLLD